MADPTARLDAADSANDPAPVNPDQVEGGADLGRRRFFRQFAGDLANTAATMVGAAQALQRTSAELASAMTTLLASTVADHPAMAWR